MNHVSVIRTIAIISGLISVLSLLMGVASELFNETGISALFFAPGISGSLFSGTVLLLLRSSPRRSRINDGLAVAVMFWFVVPLIACAPFFAVIPNSGFVAVYYEALSCLTTTGHSLANSDLGAALPSSLLMWRAILHLLGTVAIVTIAATVFSMINLGGPGIHRTRFFVTPKGSFLKSIDRIVMLISGSLIVTTILFVSALIVIGVPPRDALSDIVSALSTGLVDPNSYLQGPSRSVLHVTVIVVALLVGMLGLLLMDAYKQQRLRRVLIDPEVIAMFASLTLLTVLALISGVPLIQSAGWALSALSTSGIAILDPERLQRIPLVMVLFPVLIGGSALSAAGGIKLARVVLLSRRVGMEFAQLGYRGSVYDMKFRGRQQVDSGVMSVWVYLVGYISASILGIFLLSVLGLPFDDALRASIGALTNSGHVIGGAISEFDTFSQILIMLGMVLGRMEVIALIPVISADFWRS